jgi:chromosome segregation ATPase
MRKLPDPRWPVTSGELARDERPGDGARLNLQHVGETGDLARARSRASREGHANDELVEELELRLREWVERVDTLETEMGYLKRDLEVRIAYALELERQLDNQAGAVRHAQSEIEAIRARTSYRILDAVVRRVAARPVLYRLARGWAQRMMAWRDS